MTAYLATRRAAALLALAILALGIGLPGSPWSHAEKQGPASAIQGQHTKPTVRRSIKNDVSPPLRDIKPLPYTGEIGDEVEMPPLPAQPRVKDPVVQTTFGPGLLIPATSFDGISNQWGVYPPDTVGDV